jgi:hypothetical protein
VLELPDEMLAAILKKLSDDASIAAYIAGAAKRPDMEARLRKAAGVLDEMLKKVTDVRPTVR